MKFENKFLNMKVYFILLMSMRLYCFSS